MSALAAAQAQLPLVKGDDGEIMTQQFLSVCRLVFPVIGEPHSWCAPPPTTQAKKEASSRPPPPPKPPPFITLDKLGAAFAIVKMDIGGNIDVGRVA